jgi:aminodeoxychorismate lyase
MIVFLNGDFVPEKDAVISVFDRSFLYGDGLFETMRVVRGRPFRWSEHMERLERGATFAGIHIPFTEVSLRKFAEELIANNQMPEALLRLTLSRGVGVRGYSPKGAERPTLVMTLHEFLPVDPEKPPAWRLITSSFRLPADEALAQFKTCNKLPQILARAEADAAGADEALLLNTDGQVVEASSSNLFWVEADTVCTPPLASGILAGVTRTVVFEICEQHRIVSKETSIVPEQLRLAQGIFLSLSSVGVAEVLWLDGKPLARSPIVDRIRTAYADLLNSS